ncbi:MAG: aminotransferase class I/II-fold pyridoxal phosphate-dependent enzyme [Saprospiraceae bacterium]
MNINPADRISLVEEYYFSTKLKQIAAMRAQGADIINLGIGSPDLPPHPSVIETLYEWAQKPDAHGYQSYVGRPELRKAMAAFYKKYFQVDLNPDTEILPLIGSKEGIMHICMAFLNEGDKVLIPDPGYPTYSAALKLTGAVAVTYDLKPENNWRIDIEALTSIKPNEIKMMWINYPQMPTGQFATKEYLEQLLIWAKERNIILCNDNPYSFILNDKYVSLLSIPGAKDQAIELNSMSKAQNMAGWRVGMVCTNATWIEYILRFKSNMDSGMLLPVQMAAVKALELGDDWYQELNAVYTKRKKSAAAILDALNCTYQKDQQGMFLWAHIPDGFKDGYELSDLILKEQYVFITPGGIFGKNGNDYIRISLCTPVEVFEKALARIKTIHHPAIHLV